MSVIISLFCFFTGIVVSYLMELPTGATIVVSNLFIFLVMTFVGRIKVKA